jgi:sugar/nucleoside kinase (ribokinase family)
MNTKPKHNSSPPSNNKILCVGICSLDTIATLNEFPSPDEKLRSTSLSHAGGGNAANTAVAISRLSHNIPNLKSLDINIDLLSAVGDDSNGDAILLGLKPEKVGVDLVERYNGDSPWSYIMLVGDTRTIIHQPSTRDLSDEYVQSNLIQKDENHEQRLSNYKAVHFDVRHPKAAINVAKECRNLDIPYSVDVERPRDELLELLSGASVVICNSNYVNLVLGEIENKDKETTTNRSEFNEKEVVERFRHVLIQQAPCAKIGVMTLGGRGSFLVSLDNHLTLSDDDDDGILESTLNSPAVVERHGALWCESFPNCKIIDTTGAGDAFQGGFLTALWGYSIHQNRSNKLSSRLTVPMNKVVLSHAMRIGSKVAAKKIEQAGARDGLPRYDTFIESEFVTMLHSKSL